MPSKQSKRTFIGGLNRDTDSRLLKDGDYHHALNIRNISSEANTEGVIENIKGNAKSAYTFPSPPASGKRRITLFMPWFNYFFNYGGAGSTGFDQSVELENFDGHPRDCNDPNTYTVAGDYIDTDGDGILDTQLYDEVTNYPFPTYYAADQYLAGSSPCTNGELNPTYTNFGGPSICLLTFDIAIGFSLNEIQNPTNLFQISYNGETATDMYNYLTYWVNAYSSSIAALGLNVSIIDNNSPYFNNEYFFGESTMENIANHPDYTPGQVWAYALLFEGAYSVNSNGDEEGIFYVDLKTSSSGQPLSSGASDDLTGILFTENSDAEVPLFFAPEMTYVEDGYGYANEPQLLNNSTDWSVVGESDEGEIYLTEYANNIESVGWTIGHTINQLHVAAQLNKTFIRANATIVNDITDEGEGEDISYDTIGAYEDTRDDKIYWMVASSHYFHLILEYDLKSNTVSTVFRDSGDISTAVFNWRKEFLINDINKIGDILYWTSRQYGEPNSLNVRKSINSINLIGDNNNQYVLNEEGGTDDISLEDYYPYSLYDPDYPAEDKRQYVEVIKRPPLYAPTYTYGDDTNYSKNNLFGHMWQFRYRYHFYDNEVSAWSPISDIVSSHWDNINVSQTNLTPGEDNMITISVRNSSGIVEFIEIAGRKCKDLGLLSRGNRGPYSIVAKLDNDFSAWQLNPDSEQQISFYNDQAYPTAIAGEGERLFDAVPRSAHTQTILGNNRLTYGNYTEGFDVPKVSLSVTPQYGYIQGYDTVYGGSGWTNPVTNQLGEGVSSFKSGAFHSFGIIYYDEKGRCSTVLVDDTSRCYVKFPTERVAADIPTGNPTGQLYGAVTMKWSINHKAPDWANHYRWAYSKNNTVDEFIQFRILHAFNNQDPASPNDNRVFLSLRGLKGADDSYITVSELDPNAVPNPDISILDYDFLKGDRIRIITSGSQTTAAFPANIQAEYNNTITTYYDVKVSGLEYYAQNNPNIPIRTNTVPSTNALADDGSEDGWYLIVDEIIDSNGNVVTGYGSGNVTANTDLFEQAIVEIYRPRPDAEPGEMFYFEFSELYDIDKQTGRHLGPLAEQGETFTEDDFGNFTSNTPATGQFIYGDVYYKKRNMQMINSSTKSEQEFYVEDYFLNDFTESNHISIGRANIYSAFFRQQNKESSLTYSDVYQPASSFNGLSTFDYNEGNWEDYSRIYGTVQKIHYRNTDIIMIQEDKTFKIPIQRDILLSADGKGTVGVSNKILNPIVPVAGAYGISKNPESFVVNGDVLYWTDIRRGAAVRMSRDGITPISEVKMVDFFRDKSEHYQSYDPQYRWELDYGNIKTYMLTGDHAKFRILGGFNPKHGEYVVQMPTIARHESGWENYAEIYDDVNSYWSDLTNPETGLPLSEDVLVIGGTIAWTERQKRWTSLYSHMAEYYCKINRLFVSWDDGFIYLHDLDSDNYNTFYGITYYTELDFVVNEGPSSVKGFKSITLEANQELESDEEGVEEDEKTSYNITLVTDMTQTSVNRHNFDQRENKQYAQIPFVTTNSTGAEIIGLGLGTIEDIGQSGTVLNEVVVGGTGTDYVSPNIIEGTSSDPSSSNYGDQLYYNNGTADILVGTINEVFDVGSTDAQQLQLVSTDLIFANEFLFIKRNAFAEGDRMKGRYMEVKMKKRSKKLLEIFSASSTIFNSELSDD